MKEQLYRFYNVDNDDALINIMAHHIEQLQDRLKQRQRPMPLSTKVREG